MIAVPMQIWSGYLSQGTTMSLLKTSRGRLEHIARSALLWKAKVILTLLHDILLSAHRQENMTIPNSAWSVWRAKLELHDSFP